MSKKKDEPRAAPIPKEKPQKPEKGDVLVRVPVYEPIDVAPPKKPERERRRVNFTRLGEKDHVTKFEGEEFMLDRAMAARMVGNGQLEYVEVPK
jgi:hypothetical protein